MALSDLHTDHEENASWLSGLSKNEFRHDILIMAGDVSDDLSTLQRSLDRLCQRFKHVLFVPGNHELWTWRDTGTRTTSIDKFHVVVEAARQCGAIVGPVRMGDLRIVPLLSWYDLSFGIPHEQLRKVWNDFRACLWPTGWTYQDAAKWFFAHNNGYLPRAGHETLISFSHFMPRLDLMPARIPDDVRMLFPVLGATQIDLDLRRLSSTIHVYGHSHLNRDMVIDGVRYINNAFAYPRETRIAAKQLVCIHELG